MLKPVDNDKVSIMVSKDTIKFMDSLLRAPGCPYEPGDYESIVLFLANAWAGVAMTIANQKFNQARIIKPV